MNLFALTNDPHSRLLRFPLTDELQQAVEGVFTEQMNAFLNAVEEVVAFDGRYSPDAGELLAIDNFDDVDGLADAVANPLAVEVFDPQIHSLRSIKALFTSRLVGGAPRILIQLFEARRLIAPQKVAMFFSGDTFQKINDAGLTLDNKLLAVLEGGQLKFQSFHFLQRVFDVSDYFKIATHEECHTFASHAKLAIDDADGFVASASIPVRKKIAVILASGILDNYTTAQIVGAAQAFNVLIQTTEDDRIQLPANGPGLRDLLRFLHEDYYESPLTQTHFISNSKRMVE